MADERQDHNAEFRADAVVIGCGLAGQAAAIHLARGGLRVVCLETRESFPQIIGESLDWSAPQLFAQLGLTMEELVASGAATYKRHITVVATDGSREEFLPGAWLTERPWNVEVRTLHLDRQRVHQRLKQSAQTHGILTLHERVIGFKICDRRILSVTTAEGRSIRAPWSIDASGAVEEINNVQLYRLALFEGRKEVAAPEPARARLGR